MMAPEKKMTPPLKEFIETAKKDISNALGKKISAVTGLAPNDKGCMVEVEVVEEEHLITTSDVLATYEVQFDNEGNLLSWSRKKLRLRG
jgi:hypothetical protein